MVWAEGVGVGPAPQAATKSAMSASRAMPVNLARARATLFRPPRDRRPGRPTGSPVMPTPEVQAILDRLQEDVAAATTRAISSLGRLPASARVGLDQFGILLRLGPRADAAPGPTASSGGLSSSNLSSAGS